MKELSQQKISRILRLLYPLWVLTGIFGLIYIPGQIFTVEDPIQVAENIKSNEALFRTGVAVRLLTHLLGIAIPFFLFELFKSHNRRASVWMLLLILIAVPLAMFSEVHSLFALSLLESPIIMMQHLDITWIALNVASIFWGLWLFPLGYLAIVSGLFPKLIGYSLYISGLGYLIGAFLKVLIPEADILYSLTEYMTMGEIVFILWFVVRGIRSSVSTSEVGIS